MNRNENAHLVAPSVGAIPDEVEVAMVGAGPVGLTAATMLAGYGVRVAVLDGAAGPAPTLARLSSMLGLWRPSHPWASWTRWCEEASSLPTSAYATATGAFWTFLSAICPPLTRTA